MGKRLSCDSENGFGLKTLGFFFLAYLGLAAAFFCGPILKGVPFLIGDMDTLFYPQARFFSQRVWDGHFPLWNPLVFCGVPFAAEPRSFAFYPPYLLFALFPSPWGIYPLLAFHLAVAGCGTAFLARHSFNSGKWASFCAGAIYAFSGFFCFKMEHLDQVMTCAWFPWMFWAALRFLKEPSGKRVAALSVFYAIPFLTGALESLAYATLSLGAVLVVGAFYGCRGKPGRSIRMLLLSASALALGAGLSGIQVLPTLEMYRFAARWGGFEKGHAGWESMPPWRFVIEILLPNFWKDGAGGGSVVRVPTGFTGYLGLAGYLLAARTVWSRWKIPAVRGLAALGAFTMVLSFGRYTPVYGWFYDLGLSPFRHPTHFKIIFILCASALAAPAMNELIESRTWEGKGGMVRVVIGVLAVSVILGLALLGSRLWDLRKNSLATIVCGDLLFSGVAGLGLLAAWMARGRARRWLLLGAVFAPLVAFARYSPLWNPEPLPQEQVTRLEALAAAVRSELGPYRTFADHCIDLRVHRAMPYGLPDVYGYESGLMPLRRYWELKQSLTEESHLARTPGRRLLDLLGARFFIRDDPSSDPNLRLWRKIDRYYIYENPFARPRVRFVTRYAVMEDSAALEKIANGEWDPAREAVLDAKPLFPPGNEATLNRKAPEIISKSCNSVTLKVKAARPGILVLADTFYPGWEVTVDGEPRPCLRADFLFRGVALGPGEHEVVFQFRPASLTAGAGLSIICFLLLLSLAARKKRTDHETTGS